MIVSRERAAIASPADVLKHLRKVLKKEGPISRDREHLWVIFLTTKNRIKFVELISLGTLNSCLGHPREIFRRAIKIGAASLILAHSHPSGDSYPSEEDMVLTNRITDAGKIIGIEVLDHIIVGRTAFSFKEKGIL